MNEIEKRVLKCDVRTVLPVDNPDVLNSLTQLGRVLQRCTERAFTKQGKLRRVRTIEKTMADIWQIRECAQIFGLFLDNQVSHDAAVIQGDGSKTR